MSPATRTINVQALCKWHAFEVEIFSTEQAHLVADHNQPLLIANYWSNGMEWNEWHSRQ